MNLVARPQRSPLRNAVSVYGCTAPTPEVFHKPAFAFMLDSAVASRNFRVIQDQIRISRATNDDIVARKDLRACWKAGYN